MSADLTLTGRLHAALTTIADQYDDTLEPARRLIETHAMSSVVNPPLPVSAAVLDTRNQTCATLDRWYMDVRTTRRLKVGIERWDVPRLVAFLHVHAAYLAGTSDGARAVNQLEHCAKKLAEIAQDNAPRRFRVGKCPGTTDGQPCPGMVRAIVRSDDDMLPSELACDATPPHRWPSGVWRTLERHMHMSEKAARRLAAAIKSR